MGKLIGTWQTGTIAINTATTGEIDLGREYQYLQVRFPTLTSCTVKLTVSNITGGTFQDLGLSQTTDTTTGAYNTLFKLGGWQYIKLVTSVNQAAARTIPVRGIDLG